MDRLAVSIQGIGFRYRSLIREENVLAAGLPGDDLRRSGRKRGPTERSEIVAVHHHEHPPIPVPSRRELLVRRKECLASRVRAPEVELAPRAVSYTHLTLPTKR